MFVSPLYPAYAILAKRIQAALQSAIEAANVNHRRPRVAHNMGAIHE
jgi:hypothetical protein